MDEIRSNIAIRDSKFLCIFVDNDSRNLFEILPSRSKHTLSSYREKIPRHEWEKVRFVTIDMWEPYQAVARKYFPHCAAAVDSFRVVKHLKAAFPQPRIAVINQHDHSLERRDP